MCTSSDVCTTGVCGGTAIDCSAMDGNCLVGTCVEADGSCMAATAPDDTRCDDADACTTIDICTGGACDGAAVDCSAMTDMCNVGMCSAADGTCGTTPLADDTMCDDMDASTTGDVCTAGVCAGTVPCPRGVICLTGSSPVTYIGALTLRDGTNWVRTNASCTLSRFRVPYDVQSVRNDTGASISLEVTARWTVDGYLHAYTNPFMSTMPTAGCITGDDDFGGTSASQMTVRTFAAGAMIDIVASNYGGTSTNSYRITLSHM
jgi:hypothetical protein